MEKLLDFITTHETAIFDDKKFITTIDLDKLYMKAYFSGEMDDLSEDILAYNKIFRDLVHDLEFIKYGKKAIVKYSGQILINDVRIDTIKEWVWVDALPEVHSVWVYKYVHRDSDGRLWSFFDKTYEYKIGEVARPENPENRYAGIYTSEVGMYPSKYGNEDTAVILKLKAKYSDQIDSRMWGEVFVDSIIEYNDIDPENFICECIVPS